MKIAVFGAGAIGSYIAAALHRAGAEVTVIARGAQLAAIRENGITLITEGTRITARPFATADARDAGVQDCVFVTLKAQDFPRAVTAIATLAGPETMIVTAMNGVPYWYFYGQSSPWRDQIVQSVDPGGVLWRTIPPRQAIGCVLYPWAEVLSPAVVEQSTSNRFIIGEPDGSISARVQALSAVMKKGGLDAPVTPNIRDELWGKLWGNLSLNPLSALTRATIDRLAFEPELRKVGRAMMVEAASVAEALGVKLPMDVDERLAIAGSAGARKTSMLRDLEAGRALEIDALLGAVVELATLTGHELPLCRAILALTRELARKAAQTASNP
jgi:2-dehydropantoate 2-reductase